MMSKRWLKERARDHYYRQAKKESYRSRAAYKLKQIQKKFRVLSKGDVVVDLGSSPGGWSQVAAEIVGSKGRVLALDMEKMSPIEGVEFIHGDITSEEVLREALSRLGGKANVVISDMSPDISGNYPVDHARSVYLCDKALDFAREALMAGGNLVMKVFQGDMYQDLFKRVSSSFDSCKAYSPPASRASSSEIYIVAKGYRT